MNSNHAALHAVEKDMFFFLPKTQSTSKFQNVPLSFLRAGLDPKSNTGYPQGSINKNKIKRPLVKSLYGVSLFLQSVLSISWKQRASTWQLKDRMIRVCSLTINYLWISKDPNSILIIISQKALLSMLFSTWHKLFEAVCISSWLIQEITSGLIVSDRSWHIKGFVGT